MRTMLRYYITRECTKLIERHFDYLHQLDESVKRKEKRLDTPVDKEIKKPFYWELDSRFNPFKVRIPKKLDAYSYTLANKIVAAQYKPNCAVRYTVPKIDGSLREVCVFQIPDAAVSSAIYKSLLNKNRNRFSAYSYAYREDLNAHDAVHNIHTDWRLRGRIYVAEFDFTKFFDQISHEYLLRALDRHGFLYTPEELHVINAFLDSESSTKDKYGSAHAHRRTVGIPQGSSISLFLANLACWELDRALETVGVRFSRYADDTLIWSDSYHKIVAAYDELRRCSDLMKVPINPVKSKGIHLLTDLSSGEIAFKREVDYLGYRLTLSTVSIKNSRVDEIKKRISFIVYENLLQPLKLGIFNKNQLSTLDWDYVTTLSQIRRYLYGGLNDWSLRRYIRGQIPRLNFRGLMSYYPLVTDGSQLSKLDGWLIYVLSQSLRRREKLWTKYDGTKLPGPKANWIDSITTLRKWKSKEGKVFDLRVPSFQLINHAMQIALKKGGIQAVANPTSVYYE